jgi:two-component system cell cycle response regulator
MNLQKFLIIEDDLSTRYLLKRLLTKNFDCEVIEAENGAVGLELLQNNAPDLILLDVSMPVMDGIETLELIRANQIFKHIPVIVITAMNDSKVVGTLAQKGITDYLLKPIDHDASVNRIRKLINNLTAPATESTTESKEHILLVDKDAAFKSFFNEALSGSFIVHLASNGVDGLDLYEKYNPRHVFVCHKLGLLDKKILTQKIRELAGGKDVSIFLLMNDFKSLNTKIFTYDGIIKKSMDKVKFLSDINVLKEKSADKTTVLE